WSGSGRPVRLSSKTCRGAHRSSSDGRWIGHAGAGSGWPACRSGSTWTPGPTSTGCGSSWARPRPGSRATPAAFSTPGSLRPGTVANLPIMTTQRTAEEQRLRAAGDRSAYWKRWGPYLSERQWGTVREDYSPHGTVWESFPHDHARSRAYRWGEDGIAGITDNHGRLCFALALWNGRDPFLKERLFGLSGNEGNHGEDVKEYYFYLDSTPTHSYMKYLYKYPQAEF